jgi:hypothetical protein
MKECSQVEEFLCAPADRLVSRAWMALRERVARTTLMRVVVVASLVVIGACSTASPENSLTHPICPDSEGTPNFVATSESNVKHDDGSVRSIQNDVALAAPPCATVRSQAVCWGDNCEY